MLTQLFRRMNDLLMKWFEIRLEIPRDRRYRLAARGSGLKIGRRVELQAPGRIRIGSDVTINGDCYIAGDGGISIGDGVLIGPGVCIFSLTHNYRERAVSIRSQGTSYAAVEIEDDVWIGARSVIVAGVRVERGAVVGAGSVVTSNVHAYEIVAGVPARVIGHRE